MPCPTKQRSVSDEPRTHSPSIEHSTTEPPRSSQMVLDYRYDVRVKCHICTGPEVIQLFSSQLFSTQLSTKFQLLIKLKHRQMKKFIALSLSGIVFIMLINVKMPTIVGILTFMSKKKFRAQLS